MALPWHVVAMASRTATIMAAFLGLQQVASQVTLLDPEHALYSPALSRDQSSETVLHLLTPCGDTIWWEVLPGLRSCSCCHMCLHCYLRLDGKTWSKFTSFPRLSSQT